jgi:chemotaxis methyl-accepting protein methylase
MVRRLFHGEEPYSHACYTEKGLFTLTVEIFGSDINQRVPQVARSGITGKLLQDNGALF